MDNVVLFVFYYCFQNSIDYCVRQVYVNADKISITVWWIGYLPYIYTVVNLLILVQQERECIWKYDVCVIRGVGERVDLSPSMTDWIGSAELSNQPLLVQSYTVPLRIA